ncbi:unnamed protein product [Boreogadus saida]
MLEAKARGAAIMAIVRLKEGHTGATHMSHQQNTGRGSTAFTRSLSALYRQTAPGGRVHPLLRPLVARHAQRDLSFAVEPMDNDAPCAMRTQRPPVDTTGRAGEPAAAHCPLVARTAVRLPKFSGVTQLEPYLAQFRLAAWHNGCGAEEAVVHLALALEGTAARVLLDLDQADQRDLQALIRALERRLGERVSRNESKQLLASHRRREEESLGVYAADVQLLTRRGYPELSAATREALALHAFLRGLQPESLGQHVRLTAPQTLDAALDQGERAELELCRRPDGASVDAAGAAAAPGTKNVEVKSRQRKGRVRTATLPATETAEASHALWPQNTAPEGRTSS